MSEQEGQNVTPRASDPDRMMSAPSLRAEGEASSENRLSRRHRVFLRLAHLWFRLTRAMTLGVRAIVLDDQDRVFLVRHSYVPGWHLPGGGVETGQSAEAALAMELREEANITLVDAPVLLGIYHNLTASKRDHVLVYIVRQFLQSGPRLPDHEIVEAGFFALSALPPGTTKATMRRIAEMKGKTPVSTHW